MNENINLCEILKDCPKGTKFWSPVFGEMIFLYINKNYNSEFSIVFYESYNIDYKKAFNYKGYFTVNNEECLIFPSKDQRDWSKWKCPKKSKFDPKTLQPFDKVLVRNSFNDKWYCDFFSHIVPNTTYPYTCVGSSLKQCIPYNDDTKHLVGTLEEAPEYYRY